MTQERKQGLSRRGFFGAAAGAATATAVGMGSARPVEAQQRGEERTRARYRVTDHVEAFYRTNRYYPRGE